MKQLIKKSLVAFCMMAIIVCTSQTVFAAPISTFAVPNPVLTFEYKDWGLRNFEFQPSYTLTGTMSLKDTTQEDGRFFVPAGNEFTFNISFGSNSSGNVGYYKVNIYGGDHPYETVITNSAALQARPPVSMEDKYYTVVITAYSNEVILNSYDAWGLGME